jgi:plasmid stability protein
VQIPRGNAAPVLICEHLGMGSETAREQVIDRVLLDRHRWTAIRAEVQRAFNARLSEHNLATGTWKVGGTPVDRLLGKELCVLAWAIERLEPEKIRIAVRNWLALRPEERWWLFGMTAMAAGGIGDGDNGWRVALRYALGDQAQNELLRPRSLAENKGSGRQISCCLRIDAACGKSGLTCRALATNMVATMPISGVDPMPSLTLKDIPTSLMERLRSRAAQDRRSLNREAILLLEQALAPGAGAAPASIAEAERDAQLVAWERLGGRWPGGDAALDAMVSDIYDARTEGREVDL